MSDPCSFDAFALEIRFYSPEPQRLLNEILSRNIPVWGIEQGEGVLSFCILPVRRKLFAAFRSELRDNERWEEHPKGLVQILVLFRKRLGFYVGLLFLILSLAFSTQVLWGVDVRGNSLIPAYKIREQLASYGLSPGKLLSDIDDNEIALRFAIDHEEYVYVGVNVVGTRAKVEIREREMINEEKSSYEGASNLVAKTYGRVIRYEVLSGQIEVKKGDYVTEGTLLIGGIRETKNGSFYPVRAVGKVYAETQREFTCTVPLEDVSIVYDEEEKVSRTYEMLGLSFTVPSFFSDDEGEGEVLELVENLSLFGYELPIVVRQRVFLNSREKKDVIKLDRAENLAYDKYEQFKRDTFAESDEIISENITVSADERGVTLTAELCAVEDICREAPFRFTLDS